MIKRNLNLIFENKKETKNIDQKSKKNTLYNTEMLYKARNDAIKFYEGYSLMISQAKTKALAQVKAGNNSESLLNEIRQIVYSLYQ